MLLLFAACTLCVATAYRPTLTTSFLRPLRVPRLRLCVPRSTCLRATVAMPTAAAAFEEAISLCERRASGESQVSLASVPTLLERVFDADHQRLVKRAKRSVRNVTCLCPIDGEDGQQKFDDELLRFRDLHTRVGRQCRGGQCSDACSRVSLAGFASYAECATLQARAEALMNDGHGVRVGDSEFNLDLSSAARSGDVRTALLLLRLIERMRRAVAHEYGLPLSTVRAHYAFVSRIAADAERASYGIVHADESSDDAYHYSGVLHLGTQGMRGISDAEGDPDADAGASGIGGGIGGGDGFEGGQFAFSDALPADKATALQEALIAAFAEAEEDENDAREAVITEAILTQQTIERFSPLRGRALIFSSGWENVHAIQGVTAGVRFAMPVFLGTAPWSSVNNEEQDDNASKEEGEVDEVEKEGGREQGQPTVEELCDLWSSMSLESAGVERLRVPGLHRGRR